nr:unnamed protein product [Callosobruchus analis]
MTNVKTQLLLICTTCIVGSVSIPNDHVNYKFEYGVHDPHTHDYKSQFEHRKGKEVVGQYMLQEPDGTHRIVKYTSHPHRGFEAVVIREGHAKHPAHYGKHGHHGHEGGGDDHGEATSYVKTTHWGFQGEDHHHGHGHKY